MATQTILPNLSEEFLTESQFAALMSKSIRTIRLWQQLRVGPPRIKCGKTVRYRRAAIEQWLRSRESKPCRSPRRRTREAA